LTTSRAAYHLHLGDIAEVWLLDPAASLVKHPAISEFAGRVSDSAKAAGRSRPRCLISLADTLKNRLANRLPKGGNHE